MSIKTSITQFTKATTLISKYATTNFKLSFSTTKSASSNSIKKHKEQKIIQTHPSHLFNIITNVNQYQDFLPYCSYSKILRYSPCNTMFDAILKVGNTIFSEEYISRVKVSEISMTESTSSPIMVVESKSIKSNIIESLSSTWKITPVLASNFSTLDTSKNDNYVGQIWSQVHFEVEMSVSDPFMKVALDQVWEHVAQSQVSAFEKRCHDLS